MDWLSSAKDVILSATGIIGSIVAISGIRTWKKQLRGKVEYDLARKLLTATYRLRDTISYIRSPYMQGGEMENPPENSPYASSEEGKRYYNSMTGYRRRFESANNIRAELSADLPEAEAIWGRDIRTKFNSLLSLLNELYMEISIYLEDQVPPRSKREIPEEERKKRMSIMYEMNDVNKDPFAQRIAQAISEIEVKMKPRIDYRRRRTRKQQK